MSSDDKQSKLDFELDNLACSMTLDDSFVDASDDKPSKLDVELDNLACSMTLDDSFVDADTIQKEPSGPNSSSSNEGSAQAIASDQKEPEFAAHKKDNISPEDVGNPSSAIVSLMESLTDMISKTDSDDIRKWDRRLANHKCFEDDFIPVPRELREIEELAETYLPPSGRRAKKDALYAHLKSFDDGETPKINKIHTCLMKREPIIYCKKEGETNGKMLGHLILLNKSFFIVPDNSYNNPEKIKFQELKTNISKGLTAILHKEKKYDSCHSLSSIVSVQAFDADIAHSDDQFLPSFCLEALEEHQEDHKHYCYEIFCHSAARQESWLNALKICIPKNYGLNYEPNFFSAIIFHNVDHLQQCISNRKHTINEQDNAHGYTPLHLAVIANKIDYTSELLYSGAITDTFANDHTSPLLSATRMKNDVIIDLLKSFGATLSAPARKKEEKQKSHENAREQLLGNRNPSTANVNSDDGNIAGTTVARPSINFGKIMLSFKERGERLEALSAKSSALNNDAQNYSDMTRKLKERLEKKNKNWLGI